MSGRDDGPLRSWEITWRSRPPEVVQGHQVTWDYGNGNPFLFPGEGAAEPRFFVHGMFPGGRWRLVLTGRQQDVITIRDVTDHLAALEAMAAACQEGNDS